LTLAWSSCLTIGYITLTLLFLVEGSGIGKAGRLLEMMVLPDVNNVVLLSQQFYLSTDISAEKGVF